MKTDPEQLARGFLEKSVPPYSDCDTSVLWDCPSDGAFRATDVTLRWVQLDDDPELEAFLVTKSPLHGGYFGYVFDQRGTAWNLVGSFMCSRQCDGNDLLRVRKLTEDSPTVLLFYRDLGGSGSTIMTTTAYYLHEGKLWPVIEITNFQWAALPPPLRTERRTVLASKDRLVIHTVAEQEGRVRDSCEVHRWDAKGTKFVPAPADRDAYCSARMGKPIPDKAYSIGLPVAP
jgi:hypothetical protein